MPLVVYYWLLCVFILGAIVGSFLNVAIARLPLEKSVLWPGSRCGSCYQVIHWYDNLPLISYLWLRGRCRTCGASFSVRYLLVELSTALCFVGLFYAEVVYNIHDWPVNLAGRAWPAGGFYPWQWWVGFLWHALLLSFLIAASACDLDGREIPLQLTLTGTMIGLVGAVLLPWPWPNDPLLAAPLPAANNAGWEWQEKPIKEGVYAWPVWGPLPGWLAPGGNGSTGLATGFAGALAGTFLVRGIGGFFSKGLGNEALGLGDADLMMMAGAFLGWQQVVVAFFISVFPAVIIGILQMAIKRDNSLPFGPSLSLGLVTTWLGWKWIGPHIQPLFFFGRAMAVMAGIMLVLLLLAGFAFRFLKGNDEAP